MIASFFANAPESWWHPYSGMPPLVQVLMWLLLAVILASFVAIAMLMVKAYIELRRQRREHREADESQFLWVFFVPALNEEVTIADSVGRLAEVEVTNRIIVVIDDGSDDDTPRILAGLDVPGLVVLRRELPDARRQVGGARRRVADAARVDPRAPRARALDDR